MRFLRYFRIASYLLIASGFLALLITEYYGIPAALIFSLILVIGWQVDTGKLTIRLSPLWWNLTTIAFLGFCLADILFLGQLRSVAMVNFLVFLQATKIFAAKRYRDYMIIYIISFFELLISSVMTLSILFALICILFATSATWALITLHLKREIEAYIIRKTDGIEGEQASFDTPGINTLLNRQFFVGTFGITLLAFVLAPVIFTILPRVHEGFFFSYGMDLAPKISGFSEEVALDSFGAIRLDYRPVMRVTLPEVSDQAPLPARLYWRGLSFNYYDGKRWRSDEINRKRLFVHQYETSHWFRQRASTENLLVQQFELAAPGLEVLFGAAKLYYSEGKFLSLQYDKVTENIHVIFDPSSLHYTAYSDITTPAAEALQRDQNGYPEEITKLYLQLPELAGRIRDLAHQIVDQYDNPYDKAQAIQNFLSRNYEYSLNVRRKPSLPPLEDFLFVNKAGHCEYYATSMAILLRILGVPTRVVNGFAQGRWNEFGRFFTVRQSDAHAWVEVFFPSYGWITFDPTPATAFGDTYRQFAERKSLAASLYRYSEYLRLRWNRYIVDYSREDQAQAIVKAFLATRSARQNLKTSLNQFSQGLKQTLSQISWRDIGRIGGIVLMGLVMLWGISRLWLRVHLRLPVFRTRKNLTRNTMIRFYHTMLRILAKKGITKPSSVTPGAFARYIAQHHEDYGTDVRDLTDLYYAARYGHTDLTGQDLAQTERILRKMKSKQRSR
jgi:transglutaminase-like putative cysteine protease